MRKLLLQIHLWIGVGLGLLLVPIALTGTALVFQNELDAMMRPDLYAVTGAWRGAPVDTFVERAAAAVPRSAASAIRFSEDGPVVVVMRALPGSADGSPPQEAMRSGPPRATMVYLDPPTARVLGTASLGDSLVGSVHRFHENLLLPQWGGRSVVGWVGVAMFLLCLTGLWIWWPRNASFMRGLRWRRGPSVNTNLHHAAGFWVALPLALLSVTGVYLAFPVQGRALVGSLVSMSPQPERPGAAQPLARPTLAAQAALDAGLTVVGGGRPVALSLPTNQNRSWQLQATNEDGAILSARIDDGTGVARANAAPQTGDAIATWIRRVHEGSRHGPVWLAVAVLTGLSPALFFVTGVAIWLSKRRGERRRRALREAAGRTAADRQPVTT